MVYLPYIINYLKLSTGRIPESLYPAYHQLLLFLHAICAVSHGNLSLQNLLNASSLLKLRRELRRAIT